MIILDNSLSSIKLMIKQMEAHANKIPALVNFRSLKKDMEENEWVIATFDFIYKDTEFVCLICIIQDGEKKPEYALFRLVFININNLKEFYTHANSSRLYINDMKEFREFFGIEWSINLGDIVSQFIKHFSNFIPTKIDLKSEKKHLKHILNHLSNNDSEDPDKIYCFNMRRNPEKEKRTKYNSQKTRILRPALYSNFNVDPNISFCYSKDKKDEDTDANIIKRYTKKHGAICS